MRQRCAALTTTATTDCERARRFPQLLQLRQAPQDPQRAYALRGNLPAMDRTARSLQTRPNPSHAGTKHLVVGIRHKRPVQQQTHRSEEHTSEIQSLMRISYAVFCLKKKKKKHNKHQTRKIE